MRYIMKFRAFTLTEIIITIGLIGVLAVITAPAISDLMPDKNKIIVIKLYEQLQVLNEEIISDPGLYFQENNCEGLACANSPLRPGLLNLTDNSSEPVEYADSSKYPAILANKFNRESSVIINTNDTGGYTTLTFIPLAGVECKISSKIKTENSVPKFYGLMSIIIFGNDSEKYGVNGANACIYDKVSCPNPNKYLFMIASDGSITPMDQVSKAYLKNPTNVLSKKKAKQLIKNESFGPWPADWTEDDIPSSPSSES